MDMREVIYYCVSGLDVHKKTVVACRHRLAEGGKVEKDCKWIAQLMQYGLLKASFVSSPEVRHWWDLTRHRTELRDQEPVAVSSQAEGNP